MKLHLLAAAALAAVASRYALAVSEDAAMAECQRFAQEDNVPDEELLSYLDICMRESYGPKIRAPQTTRPGTGNDASYGTFVDPRSK